MEDAELAELAELAWDGDATAQKALDSLPSVEDDELDID